MYLICYDISNNRLRTKISKELENYGVRKQYSVFECDLNKKRFQELYGKLCKLTAEMEEGNIRIYSICEKCLPKTRIIGIPSSSDKIIEEEVIIL